MGILKQTLAFGTDHGRLNNRTREGVQFRCDTKMQSTFVTFYQEHGFAITSELNEQIKSAAVRYCDSLKAATTSTAITVLQGG